MRVWTRRLTNSWRTKRQRQRGAVSGFKPKTMPDKELNVLYEQPAQWSDQGRAVYFVWGSWTIIINTFPNVEWWPDLMVFMAMLNIHPWNEGGEGTCVSHAISKAVVDIFDSKGFDTSQDNITRNFINRLKFSISASYMFVNYCILFIYISVLTGVNAGR